MHVREEVFAEVPHRQFVFTIPKRLRIYFRFNRELLGHNECIFGLTDSYPTRHEWIRQEMLEDIEKKCVAFSCMELYGWYA